MKEISQADFMPIDSPMALILTIINAFSCVFGSLGNFALITVILLHKQLHGASEMLLMSLAFADFVSCGVYLPLLLVRINSNEKLPTAMNQSRRAIGQVATVCASLNLLMLMVDRLIFFYRPLRYTYWMRKRIVTSIILLIFSISLFEGFYAYFDMIKSQYPKTALVGVPLVIFFALHYAICRLAQAHRNQVTTQEQSLQHNYNINNGAIVQAKRNVRTVMLFGILYLLTWLPVTIFQLWRSITDYHDPKSFQKYFYLLLTIQQISACIDPYLCCYRNQKVKAVFKKFLYIRKYFKFGGLSANTMSMSFSDGPDNNNGDRNMAHAKAAVVSDSSENILGSKVLAESNDNNSDSLDRIISSSVERASQNEYESFENIYKKINYSADSTMGKNTEKSTVEESTLSLSESFGIVCKIRVNERCNVDCNIRDMSSLQNTAMDISESLHNTRTTQVLEQTEGDSVHSELGKNTDLPSDVITEQLSEYERLPKINNEGQTVAVENVEEMDSLSSGEVVLNSNKTNELFDMKQTEEKQLLEQTLEQHLGLKESLEEPLQESLEESLELEQSEIEQSELEQSELEQVTLEECPEQSLEDV